MLTRPSSGGSGSKVCRHFLSCMVSGVPTRSDGKPSRPPRRGSGNGKGDGGITPPVESQFKPGRSGNPGGRAKTYWAFKEWCQERCADEQDVLLAALRGGEKWAWELILAYGYGRPETRVTVKGNISHDISSLTDAELTRIALGSGSGTTEAPGNSGGPDDMVH